MLDSFGDALRAMRESAGLSLAALGRRAGVSKQHLGNLENGHRPPTPDAARAVDKALGGGGVLIELAALEGVDSMRRRALLATIGAATGLGAVSGPHALADLVRHGLLAAAGEDEDWDGVVDDAGRRLVTDSSPLFGSALLVNLALLREQITRDAQPDLLRAAAALGQIYGLWLGNGSHLGGAHQWYRSAATLAQRSGDTHMHAWVLGRAASRAVYEGWTVQRTLATAEQALALSSQQATTGALEAQAAVVSVHALTGNVDRGRAAVRAMEDIVARLPDADLMGIAAPAARTLFLSAFLECRAGDLGAAMRACEAAEPALRDLPLWLVETQVYRARALVAAGDVLAGLGSALDAVQGLRHDVRVIGVAVRDVLSQVPAGQRPAAADQLAQHADPAPGPWEML